MSNSRHLVTRTLKKNGFFYLATICTLFFFSPYAVWGAEWDLTPRLSLVSTYLDNINRATPGSENSDLVNQVTPGVTLSADGKRLDGSLNYTLSNYFYTKGTANNRRDHALSGNFRIEPVRNFLFIDGNGQYTQQLLNETDVGSDNSVFSSSARTDVASATLRPYIQYSFRRGTSLNLGYQLDKVRYKNTDSGDADSQTLSFMFSDKPLSQAFGYSIAASNREMQRKAGADLVSDQVSLELTYRVSRYLGLIGKIGDESIEIELANQTLEVGGSSWGAGLNITPNRRALARIIVGERYYGRSLEAQIRYNRRWQTWSLNYSESVTDSFVQLLLTSADPTGQIAANAATSRRLDSYLERRTTGSWVITGSKTSLNFSVSNSDREYLSDGAKDELFSLLASVNRKLTPRISMYGSVNHSRSDTIVASAVSKLYGATGQFTFRAKKIYEFAVGARVEKRRSESASLTYDANSVFLRATMEW